jgi:hypothetical protein
MTTQMASIAITPHMRTITPMDQATTITMTTT